MRLICLTICFLIGLLPAAASAVQAEPPAEESAGPQDALRREFDAALQAMNAARQHGPLEIPFLGQAVLHLPAGYSFAPNPAAARFMAAIGNQVDDSFLGLILPEEKEAEWVASLTFEKSGYIRDDDAKSWNVEEMLNTLKESAEDINRSRGSRGLPELEVIGWAESPNYDSENHRLVWSLTVGTKGAHSDEPQSVNYNTYALGRDGYFSLNLVTTLDDLQQRKPIANTLLASLEFDQGKRYEDFNAETDPTAAFGLAALVGGALAAKKFGLFALLGVFIAKFGKVIAVAAVALFGLFGRQFGRKKGAGGSLDA